ncbi:hypothetical protein [Fibrobacter sp. UWB12]|uniref:hypothetical protein n=1 Tax=Fibrobacter sp. UWB12 TaxID=1896203 RepID=UPI00091C4B32|nr:hypothetical protein [Fibrobacter sp. UWB12]SHK58235.1 hypothetical protein SAMN05720759_10432 [Fibrobacter sp. UWB12]
MKQISLILASCVAATASAATFNAQGKAIDSKDAKNPGIVKFEKSKVAATKSNLNKSKSLAKTYTVDHIATPLIGFFDSDANDGRYITLNDHNYYESDYLGVIGNYERNDAPRSSYNSKKKNYYNSAAPYPSNSGYECKKVSSIYAPDPYENTFYYTFANINDNNFLTNLGLYTSSSRCYNSGWQQNTCGAGVNLYNVVGDNPIAFNNNSCTNSTSRDYTLGINHFYANRVIKAILPEINNTIPSSQSIINEGTARQNHQFAVYSKYPSSPYAQNVQVINTIASSTKDVNTYGQEAAGIDDYIYYNRVIEFVPYTENGQKTGAGLSMNAISVNEADEIGIIHTYGINNPYLKESDSRSRYLKPDIYQLSYIRDEGNYIKLSKNNQTDYKIMGIADGWGGSTVAAAMTAGLISKYPFYRWHPEVVKALWISAQKDMNNVKDIYRFTGGFYSTGRPEAVTTGAHMAKMYPLIKGNRSRYWYGNNGDFFNDNKITFTENVEPGKNYTLAIAWLVSGDYTLNEKSLQSNYKMTIRYKNYSTHSGYTSPTTSTISPSTYRLLSVTIPSTVTQIEVVIERVKNTGDRVVLGYNIHKNN